MNTTFRIIKYELSDVARSWWVAIYGAFFFVSTLLLLQFSGGIERALLSMANVVLIIVPLVCILLGTMYVYNAREFIEMLLAQPVDRSSLFKALYIGLLLPLVGSFLLGVGLPLAIHIGVIPVTAALFLVLSGVLLTAVFVGFGVLITTRIEDRVRGLGAAILVWLTLAVVYDAVVLLLANRFSEFPLEQPLLVLTVLNPVDLARVLLLLQFEASALMGYTGAVFEQFFGTAMGIGISFSALLAWAIIPVFSGCRFFGRKDF